MPLAPGGKLIFLNKYYGRVEADTKGMRMATGRLSRDQKRWQGVCCIWILFMVRIFSFHQPFSFLLTALGFGHAAPCFSFMVFPTHLLYILSRLPSNFESTIFCSCLITEYVSEAAVPCLSFTANTGRAMRLMLGLVHLVGLLVSDRG